MAPCNKEERQSGGVEYSTQRKEAQNGSLKSQTEKLEVKGSIDLELGTMKASRTPLVILIGGFSWVYYCTFNTESDPRSKGYYFLDNTANIFILCFAYIVCSLTLGPRLMVNRNPIKFKKIMMAYNLFQVILCTYMFIELGIIGWFFDYNWYCEPNDYSDKPKSIRMVKVAYLFFFSKVLDFADTFFFILNKKWSNVSLLHVVHHSSMCLTMWFGVKYTSVGHLSFLGFLNSGIHVLMYSYYFLAAMGPTVQRYLWWKKYLTSIQLIQFIAIFLHTTQIFFNGCPNVPKGLAFLTCIYAFVYFGLFIDFYLKVYRNPSQKSRSTSKKATHKNVPNGSIGSSQNVSEALKSPSSLLNNTCLRERPTMIAE